MDARIGFPNEHLAGESDEGLSSPSYATAVGLLMEGLEKETKDEEEVVAQITEEPQEGSAQETPPVVEEKPTFKKKSFFEKFTESLKDFLDNAE